MAYLGWELGLESSDHLRHTLHQSALHLVVFVSLSTVLNSVDLIS